MAAKTKAPVREAPPEGAERTREVVEREHGRISEAIRRGAEELAEARQDLMVAQGEHAVALTDAAAMGRPLPDDSEARALRERVELLERQLSVLRSRFPALEEEYAALLLADAEASWQERRGERAKVEAEVKAAIEREQAKLGKAKEAEYAAEVERRALQARLDAVERQTGTYVLKEIERLRALEEQHYAEAERGGWVALGQDPHSGFGGMRDDGSPYREHIERLEARAQELGLL
jgi:hypothetical protein